MNLGRDLWSNLGLIPHLLLSNLIYLCNLSFNKHKLKAVYKSVKHEHKVTYVSAMY